MLKEFFRKVMKQVCLRQNLLDNSFYVLYTMKSIFKVMSHASHLMLTTTTQEFKWDLY